MWLGSAFDRLAQQRIFAERGWIDAQPGMVAQGRAVCLFVGPKTAPNDLIDLIERFLRVFVYVAPKARPDWMQAVSSAGHFAYPYAVLVGREDGLDHCRRLARDGNPGLRGASIVHLTANADPRRLRQVQALYADANVLPQPPYFMAGGDDRVLTSVLLDEDGEAIGATMYHQLAGVGPGFDAIACGLNSTVRPRRAGVSPAGERVRSLSPAAWLNASAILRCRELFGVREIWSCARAANRRAIAFHHQLGARGSEEVSFFCAEHHMALPDRRHTGEAATLTAR